MQMTSAQIAVVIALARCGIAHETPSAAYLHQMRRLIKVLPLEHGEKVQAMLVWHEEGRKKRDTMLAAATASPAPSAALMPHASEKKGLNETF